MNKKTWLRTLNAPRTESFTICLKENHVFKSPPKISIQKCPLQKFPHLPVRNEVKQKFLARKLSSFPMGCVSAPTDLVWLVVPESSSVDRNVRNSCAAGGPLGDKSHHFHADWLLPTGGFEWVFFLFGVIYGNQFCFNRNVDSSWKLGPLGSLQPRQSVTRARLLKATFHAFLPLVSCRISTFKHNPTTGRGGGGRDLKVSSGLHLAPTNAPLPPQQQTLDLGASSMLVKGLYGLFSCCWNVARPAWNPFIAIVVLQLLHFHFHWDCCAGGRCSALYFLLQLHSKLMHWIDPSQTVCVCVCIYNVV